jgi:bifunctional non-homologous end joining protein LigD
MLLAAGEVPDGEAWALEVKWDGCRAQLRYDGRAPTLRTRNGRECSDDFPELLEISDALRKRRVILDAEARLPSQRRAPRLRAAAPPPLRKPREPHPVVFQVFDGLSRDSPNRERCGSRGCSQS